MSNDSEQPQEGAEKGNVVQSPREATDSKTERLKAWMAANLPVIAAIFTAATFVLIIASIFWPFTPFSSGSQATLLRELAVTEVARGLITFLVAVTTVGIALILTVFMVVTENRDADGKFGKAKEVLSTLIGVLGTIVGFYFGSTTIPTQQHETHSLAVSQALISPSTAKTGDKFNVTADIIGGKPPYEYILSFKPSTIGPVTKSGISGKINEQFAVPSEAKPGSDLDVAIKVKDQGGVSFEIDKVGKLAILP
ncbi:MAG: hypothetical protein OJF51_000222 [Nitrospira sp.]|jgi:hypothetical protein|nr:MAG: hypothetical protein OJF51_000222 [Nitrospira sp.]